MNIFKIKNKKINFNISYYNFFKEHFYISRSETLPFDSSWEKSKYSVNKINSDFTQFNEMSFDIGGKTLVKNYIRGDLKINPNYYLPEDFRQIYSPFNSLYDCLVTASKLFYVNGERRFIPGMFRINFKKNTIIEDKKWNDLIYKIAKNIFEKNWSFCFMKNMDLIIIKSIDPFAGFCISNKDINMIKEINFDGELDPVLSNHYKDVNYSLSGNLIRINSKNFYQLIKSKNANNVYTYSLLLLRFEDYTLKLIKSSKKLFAGNKLFICSIFKNKKSLVFYGGAHDRFSISYKIDINQIFA